VLEIWWTCTAPNKTSICILVNIRSAKGVLYGWINCLDLKSADPWDNLVAFNDCMIINASNLSRMLGLFYFSRTASQSLILLMSKKQIDRLLPFILTFILLFRQPEISQGRPRYFVCESYRNTDFHPWKAELS